MTMLLPSEYRRLGGEIAPADDGARLDGYLARHFPFLSRAGWQRRIEARGLLVNGRGVKSAARLKAGDLLALFAPPTAEPPVDRGVCVLWEEGGVMAVFKPGNLPMHENGPYRKNTFTEIVWQTLGREWSAVHRLDRETSGLVLCAATAELRGRLAADLAARLVQKEYLAVARGQPAGPRWRHDGAIGGLAGSAIRIKKWVVPDGLEARTDFEVVETAPAAGACLLRARPRTGRTNQIRIHAAHAGHVLLGDKLYHPDETVFLDYFAHGLTPRIAQLTGFPRLCLHAAALTFVHPGTRAEVRVESPLPPDLVELWAALRAGSTPASLRWDLPEGPLPGSEVFQLLEGEAEGLEQPV